jgi:hypothetical protein
MFQDVAKGLQDLLDYKGDVEEDFCMSFQVKLFLKTHYALGKNKFLIL